MAGGYPAKHHHLNCSHDLLGNDINKKSRGGSVVSFTIATRVSSPDDVPSGRGYVISTEYSRATTWKEEKLQLLRKYTTLDKISTGSILDEVG